MRSDQVSVIPDELKSIYNYVMPDPIEGWLIDKSVNTSIFGNNIQVFDLSNLIIWFNAKIKSNDTYEKMVKVLCKLVACIQFDRAIS